MNDEFLIQLVKERRELYDVEYKLYQDQTKREEAWNDIAKKLKLSAFDCKDRWKRLRDNYRKAKKLRLLKKRRGMKQIKKIKHENLLAFINNVIDLNDSEQVKDSVVDEDKASESDESSEPLKEAEDKEAIVPETPAGRFLVIDATRNCTESTPASDTVVSFFTNLGETVKTFPEEIQIRVKRDIFKIVNEAEEEIYGCNSRNNFVKVKCERI